MASTSAAAVASNFPYTDPRSSQPRFAYPSSSDEQAHSTGDESDDPPSFFVRALYDFESNDASSLSFTKGALIEVLTQLESGWWDGLLDNHVRGWFPSNYVEPISDQEAEVELMARAQLHAQYSLGLPSQPSVESDSFSRLGYGAGFDGLQALIKGDEIGNSDAFSQLAEAAMLDPRRHMFDGASPQIAQALHAQQSSASPYRHVASSSANSGSVTLDSGIPTYPHTSDPHRNSTATSTSEQQLALERERARATSNPLQGSSTASPLLAAAAAAAAARPRAATGSQAHLPRGGDVWVPKIPQSGQTVYYNIRTGATSSQMPPDAIIGQSDAAESSSSSRLQPQPMIRTTSSGQNSSADSRKDLYDANHLGPDHSRANSLSTSQESRPSSANSSNTAIFHNGTAPVRAPSSNAADRMPNPASVPKPWKLRLTDDEKYFFYVHRNTNEIRWNCADAKTKLTILSNVTPRSRSPRHSTIPSTSPLEHSSGLSKLGAGLNVTQGISALHLDSDDSDLDGDMNPALPGKPPKAFSSTNANRIASASSSVAAYAHHPVLSPPKISPPTLLHEETTAYELQKSLAPASVPPVSALVRRANDVIRHLATIATEQIGTDGLAESDASPCIPASDGVYLPRLSNATSDVVAAIREVLYATGSLSLSNNDLAPISRLVSSHLDQAAGLKSLSENAAAANGVKLGLYSDILHTLYTAPHGADAAALHLFGINPKDSVASTPGPLHPLGRKLNAVVSKLVLSSRQVIDHTVTLASSPTSGTESTMTDLDADVFSKLYKCRHRLREDALELMRTLQTLGAEAEKSRSTALGAAHSRGWLRRVQGSFESDLGLNGIGPTSFGSGMAAGWLGNGFVLPSKYETALLKAESKGTRNNPFDQRRDTESAVVRGLLTLRRIPEKRLDQQMISQLKKAITRLDAAGKIVAAQKVGSSQGVAASSVLSRFGALEQSIESLDLAASLDVDGPNVKDAKSSSINERNAINAIKARELMRRFVVLKQAAYDASCSLFLALQDQGSSTSASNGSAVQEQAVKLVRLSSSVVKTLEELGKVAEEQLKDASPFLGARASVYGSEDGLSMPSTGIFSRKVNNTSNGLHEELEEMARYGRGNEAGDTEEEAEFMYLGPGIAVPNGPRARSGSRATTGSTTNSPVTSLAPGGRLGSTHAPSSYRQRSTSVTTGGSVRSMQSYTDGSSRILSRRGTLVDGSTPGSIDEDGESTRAGSGKLRRLLGDEAPLAQTLTQDSENSVGTSATALSSLPRRKDDEVPWFLEPDYMGDDIVIAQDGSVKGATLEALLARLTMHNSFDASFNNTFLMTYRSFTTTQTLLDLLAQRFRILPPEGLSEEELALWTEKKQIPIRLRVFNVLKMWLEMHFYEGEDEPYLDQVRRFAVEEMGEAASMKAPSQHLQRLVERRQGDGEQMIRKMVLPNSAPAPILPKNLKKLKFLEIDPLELARQLTLLESRLYNKVKPAECLGLKWTKPGNDVHAKGIMESINTHNRISAWVAETILQQEDLKKRAALIKHFISIADRCRALNNFSGMWAIVSALSTAPIHRLRRTWDAVSQKHVLVFESLETLMSASRNWANYRETIHKLNPPCVPFLGRYLGDLTFIEDGNRDRLKENDQLINFGKRQKTAEVIREITIHQSTPYNLQVVPALEKYIEANLVDARSADDLYEQSLVLEPREREDEKIARLLQESGFL